MPPTWNDHHDSKPNLKSSNNILLNLMIPVPRWEHGLSQSFDTISLSRAIVAFHRYGVSCSCRHSGLVRGASCITFPKRVSIIQLQANIMANLVGLSCGCRICGSPFFHARVHSGSDVIAFWIRTWATLGVCDLPVDNEPIVLLYFGT